MTKMTSVMIVVSCLAAATLFAASGCETMEAVFGGDPVKAPDLTELSELQQMINELSANQTEQLQHLRDQFADDPDTLAQIESLEHQIAGLQSKLDSGIGDLNESVAAVLAKFTGPEGQITPESVGTGAALMLPPPWNLVAIIGTGLLGGLVEKKRKDGQMATVAQEKDSLINSVQTDMKSIIEGIKAVSLKDPEFKRKLSENEGTLLSHYTDGAFDVVRKVSS